MARCRHGFEITQVRCPTGCGGPKRTERRAGNGSAGLEGPERQRRNPAPDVTDEEIAAVLSSAPSVKGAMSKLGCSWQFISERVEEGSKELRAAYGAARERGYRTRVPPMGRRRRQA